MCRCLSERFCRDCGTEPARWFDGRKARARRCPEGFTHTPCCSGGQPEFRQDDSVQRPDRPPAKGRQLPRCDGRAKGRAPPARRRPGGNSSRSAGDIQPHPGIPRRTDRHRHTPRNCGSYPSPRRRYLRRGRKPPRTESLPRQPDHRPPDTDRHCTQHDRYRGKVRDQDRRTITRARTRCTGHSHGCEQIGRDRRTHIGPRGAPRGEQPGERMASPRSGGAGDR